MAQHLDVTRAVDDAPEGRHIGAIFDFDGTLMAGFSATEFLKEQVRRGRMSVTQFVEMLSTVGSFSLGNVGFSGLMTSSAKLLKGIREESYIEFGEEVYKNQIARLIYPESRALVRAHLRKGHTVAIVSSATPYQVEPAARDLDIENVLCSNLEVVDGEFTGGIVKPLCFGEGKVLAAESLAEKFGVDLSQSYFYTDSDDDLLLLERVGKPNALNPNSALVKIAERRGWPVRRFMSRGRPRVSDMLRSLAADTSLLPVFLAGLPIWALTGSRREAQNFSMSLFADVASALVGLNLKVKGERFLWEQRPAVFIFNHQSKADVIITAKLLRRDIAGVGKKEIGNYPVLGKIMELSGTVLIDRENTASAIAAMEPLVNIMKVEGKSVLIAPEGTRTVSPKLGSFKKGAFHLAMQAGVPIVPIVIHNALDMAPKGEFVYRKATIEVDVLPPIETTDWKKEDIGRHVAEVRQLYLEVLGQTAAKAGDAVEEPVIEKTAGQKPAKTAAGKRKRNTNGSGADTHSDGA